MRIKEIKIKMDKDLRNWAKTLNYVVDATDLVITDLKGNILKVV